MMDTSTSAAEMKFYVEVALKAMQQNKESRAKDHEAHDDLVVGLRRKVNESLQQTRKNVYKAFDQVAD